MLACLTVERISGFRAGGGMYGVTDLLGDCLWHYRRARRGGGFTNLGGLYHEVPRVMQAVYAAATFHEPLLIFRGSSATANDLAFILFHLYISAICCRSE